MKPAKKQSTEITGETPSDYSEPGISKLLYTFWYNYDHVIPKKLIPFSSAIEPITPPKVEAGGIGAMVSLAEMFHYRIRGRTVPYNSFLYRPNNVPISKRGKIDLTWSQEDKHKLSEGLIESLNFEKRKANRIYRIAKELYKIMNALPYEEKANEAVYLHTLLIDILFYEYDVIQISQRGRKVVYGDPIQLLENLINNVDIYDKKTTNSPKSFLQELRSYWKNKCSSQVMDKIIQLTLDMTQTHNTYKLSVEEHETLINLGFVEKIKQRFKSIDLTIENNGHHTFYVDKENFELNDYFKKLQKWEVRVLFLPDEAVQKILKLSQDSKNFSGSNSPSADSFKNILVNQLGYNKDDIHVYPPQNNSSKKGFLIEVSDILCPIFHKIINSKNITEEKIKPPSTDKLPSPKNFNKKPNLETKQVRENKDQNKLLKISVENIEEFLRARNINLLEDPNNIPQDVVYIVANFLEDHGLTASKLPGISMTFNERTTTRQDFITKHLLSLIQYKQVLNGKKKGITLFKSFRVWAGKKDSLVSLVNTFLKMMRDGEIEQKNIGVIIKEVLDKKNVKDCIWSSTTEERIHALANCFDTDYVFENSGLKHSLKRLFC